MDIQSASATIQAIIAPAVMVTSSGILIHGMIEHYGAINVRIRSQTAERLDLVLIAPASGHEQRSDERIAEIDHELPMLVHRHQQVHTAILFGYGAVTGLVASMFVIGAAALAHSNTLGTLALLVFLSGTTMLLLGGGYMAAEIRTSQASVAFEATRVTELSPSWSRSDTLKDPHRRSP